MSTVTDNLKEMELLWNSINVFLIIIDSSGSMQSYAKEMEKRLKEFSRRMSLMDEAGSVIISRVDFEDSYSQTKYDRVENFKTSYYANGGTELYKAIYETLPTLIGSENEEGAVQILQDQGYEPKFTIVVFSDGEDNNGKRSRYREKAKKMVERVNEMHGVTAFVSFGGDISRNVAEDLGFKNIDSKYDLEQAFEAITSSCIRQSQSDVSLTDTFFDNN
ncbi:MAG: VWA domain-containing protein [Clostridia bacterium]|nr:VWA domain-containing protein [Clostridia bacterium]